MKYRLYCLSISSKSFLLSVFCIFLSQVSFGIVSSDIPITLHSYLRDIADLVLDYHNTVHIGVK